MILLAKIYLIVLVIIIRIIDNNYYYINKYVLLLIFISRKRNDKDILIKIIYKIYFTNNLEVRILISTDIINSKKIDIITSKGEVYINIYKVTININFKPRSRGII